MKCRNKFVSILLILCFVSLTGCGTGRLADKLDREIQKYNDSNVSYEEAVYAIDELRGEAKNEDETKCVEAAYVLLDKIKQSKEEYEKAVSLSNGEEYESALEHCDNVVEEDSNYQDMLALKSDIKANWIKEVTAQCDKYMEENKYSNAIDLCEKVQKKLDSDEIRKKSDEVLTKYKENVESQVQEAVDKKAYVDAIEAYRAIRTYTDDPSYDTKIESIEDEYTNYAIEQAEQLIAGEDFAGASKEVENALKVVQTTGLRDELQNEKERVELFVPKSLMDLEFFYKEEGDYVSLERWETDESDNVGNSGYTGIKATTTYSHNESSVSYLIEGKYNTFSGIFALHSDSRDLTNSEEFNAKLLVYGDGKVLYESSLIYGGVKPVEFDVDTTGVDELKLVWITTKDGYGRPFIVGLLNPMLKNKYTSSSGASEPETEETSESVEEPVTEETSESVEEPVTEETSE